MNTSNFGLFLGVGLLTTLPALADGYTDPAAPTLTGGPASNAQHRLSFTPYPSADVLRMLRSEPLGAPWIEDVSGVFSNLTWTASAPAGNAFHRLEVQPLGSNALLTATVLNKLGYGPTPELLDRLWQNSGNNSAAAWIAEQSAPETITERAGLAHTNIAFIQSRFGTATNPIPGSLAINSGPGTASTTDIQAWLALNAVFADRQLHEVLTQFWENHFVTWMGKSANFFIGAQYRDGFPQRAACEWEWREVSRWREAMLRTNWTFYDMLRISAESPAMITYLDTATSRGNPPNIPNENFSRELLELFTVGVDNGYDQTDIVAMAPCWTGWTVQLVNATNALNPFAPQSTVKIDPAGPNAFTNLVGVWAMNFMFNRHATGAKTIFPGKTVPARFGPPYTTKTYGANATAGLYELVIPARTTTNGIVDGYDIITHLADLPFTQEYMSVKLCRLFVHDGFATGYNFTDAATTPEEDLVRACMAAWEGASPKGQMRPVLTAIFNSALFRGHGGNAHKVKTPLEFCASAIRALRQSTNGTGNHGTWLAYTDGYGLTFSQGGDARSQGNASALMRIGGMSLFNREAPDGYPENASGWVDAGSLAERIRFISSLCKPAAGTGSTSKNDQNTSLLSNVTDPVRLLLLRLPVVADQHDAGKVADLFLGLLFPGEGRASLDAYRHIALNYLNTDDTGNSPSLFSGLTISNASGSAYDNRVRGLVAMLMSLQRFHEQ